MKAKGKVMTSATTKNGFTKAGALTLVVLSLASLSGTGAVAASPASMVNVQVRTDLCETPAIHIEQCQDVTNLIKRGEVVCALGDVDQGVAESVNGDCVTVLEEECMDWHTLFMVPDDPHWGYYGMATFRWSAAFSIPVLVDEAEDSAADALMTASDVISYASEMLDDAPGWDEALADFAINAGHIDADDPPRDKIEDDGRMCFDVTGTYVSFAKSAGAYTEYYCDDLGNCFMAYDVPYNAEKMPGRIFAV